MLRSGGEGGSVAAICELAKLRTEYRMEYPSLVRLLGPRHLNERWPGGDVASPLPVRGEVKRSAAEIFRTQFDRLAVWRAVGGMIPGIAIAVQGVGRRDTFGCDQLLQTGEPVPVIGFAGVGIASGLRAPDFIGQRRGPFRPCEQSPRMQRDRHRKRLRFPRL